VFVNKVLSVDWRSLMCMVRYHMKNKQTQINMLQVTTLLKHSMNVKLINITTGVATILTLTASVDTRNV